MSRENNLAITKIMVNLLGVLLLILGILITYFSIQAESGIPSPKLFTPLGILVIISGTILTVAWKG
jgi:uncharacterized membrane protein